MTNFKDKVVYQIYPKSFQDSNGDGFGDLKGVTQRLDYLQKLGVDYLWLTPFFISPQNDNGYDVADYRKIDPRYGTMEDLEELIREADAREIGLMLDMVFNHTSTEHIWFQKALEGDEKYQNYYIFKEGTPDKIPTNWESKFGGPAWEYVPSLGKWYLHLYDVTQAEPWIEVQKNYKTINTEAEEKESDSILNFYKKLIQLRKELPVIANGSIQFLDEESEGVIGYEREKEGTKLVVLCNLCEEENKAAWQREWDSYELLLGNYSDGKVDGTLRPYECKVMCSI